MYLKRLLGNRVITYFLKGWETLLCRILRPQTSHTSEKCAKATNKPKTWTQLLAPAQSTGSSRLPEFHWKAVKSENITAFCSPVIQLTQRFGGHLAHSRLSPPFLLLHSHHLLCQEPSKGHLHPTIKEEAPNFSASGRCFSFSEGLAISRRWSACLWHSLFPASQIHPAGQVNSKHLGEKPQADKEGQGVWTTGAT